MVDWNFYLEASESFARITWEISVPGPADEQRLFYRSKVRTIAACLLIVTSDNYRIDRDRRDALDQRSGREFGIYHDDDVANAHAFCPMY